MRIVVIGQDQKHYIGEIREENPYEYLRSMHGRMMTLRNVYQLVVLDQEVTDATTGQIAGLQRSHILMKIDTAKGALPELHITASAWYDPEACGINDHFDALIAAVEKAPVRSSLPTIVPAGPGALAALGPRKGTL